MAITETYFRPADYIDEISTVALVRELEARALPKPNEMAVILDWLREAWTRRDGTLYRLAIERLEKAASEAGLFGGTLPMTLAAHPTEHHRG